MVPEEDPAIDGGGDDGGTGPPEDGPQMGQEDQGTGALEETDMAPRPSGRSRCSGVFWCGTGTADRAASVGGAKAAGRCVHSGTYFVACKGAGWNNQ